MARIDSLLQALVELGGSDLPVSAGAPPVFRVNGGLQRARHPDLSAEEVEDLLLEVLSGEEAELLETRRNLDFGYGVQGLARFRGNAYRHRKGLGATFRCIPASPPRWTPWACRQWSGGWRWRSGAWWW